MILRKIKKITDRLINLVYKYKISFLKYRQNTGEVVLISENGHLRALKIAKALNYIGIEPILLTKSLVLEKNIRFKKIINYRHHHHAAYILKKYYLGSIFHVFCNWDYTIASILIKKRLGIVLVDSMDVINFFTKDEIQKKYKKQISLEKYSIENADGLVCRDLRTNLLKKNGWKLPKRLLFMEYVDKKDSEVRKKINKSLVYVGNLELDPNNSVAYQYDLAGKLKNQKIKFIVFPSVASHCQRLKKIFLDCDEEILDNLMIDIRENIHSSELEEALSNYSFGLLISTKKINFINDHDTYHSLMDRYFFAAKVFDYFNAGLIPVVQNSKFIRFILRRLNIGHVVNSMEEIVDYINDNDGKEIIFKYEKNFSLIGNSSRLRVFLEGVKGGW
jgi:hypothetical protein